LAFFTAQAAETGVPILTAEVSSNDAPPANLTDLYSLTETVREEKMQECLEAGIPESKCSPFIQCPLTLRMVLVAEIIADFQPDKLRLFVQTTVESIEFRDADRDGMADEAYALIAPLMPVDEAQRMLGEMLQQPLEVQGLYADSVQLLLDSCFRKIS
jgi:hypothetical protein